MKKKVEDQNFLVIDDDTAFRERLVMALKHRGFVAFGASNADESLRIIESNKIDYITLDLKMPGISGIPLLKKITEINSTAKVLILTGYGSITTTIEAIKSGAQYYLTKPADLDQILKSFKITDDAKELSHEFSIPSLSEVETEYLNRVVDDCNGNITKAAQKLGLHRRSLQRKLLKLT